MNVVLWVLQIVLALAFAAAGTFKLTKSRAALAEQQMGWVEDFSDSAVKGIGAAELLGAVGLILPAWTGIAPVLTPLAATGLAITMIGALIVHARRHETKAFPPPLVLGVLALIVAWGRFGPYSY
jgi:uncharacterized membrane protein YphA (DoxX/SURF4 family)